LDVIVLWVIAALMAVFTAWLLKMGSTIKTLTDAGLVLFLLAMMASMFMSTVIYLYFPSFVTVFELVALNMISMSVALIPILSALFRGDRQLDETRNGSTVSTRSIVFGTAIALVILSEVFMGWTFAIVAGAASTSSQSVLSSLVVSMSTYWFIFTMASEMAVTLYLVGRKFPSVFRWLVAIQIVVMVLSPTAISNSTWSIDTLLGSTAVMILAFIVVFEYIFKNRSLAGGASQYIVRLIGAYALMMVGLLLWLVDGEVLLFVLSIVAEMVIYFTIVLDEKRLVAEPVVAWQTRPLWVLALLGAAFVAMCFMGGVLDVVALGTNYYVLWVVAAAMAVFTAWLLTKGLTIKTLTDAGLVLFLFVMMASMFVTAVVYLYAPTFSTVVSLVALDAALMGIGLIPILAAVFGGDRQLAETQEGAIVSARGLVIATIITLAILSEALMGWAFALLGGAASVSTQSVLSALVDSMSTSWFIFTMASEMAITLYLVGRKFPSAFRWLVAIQIAVMVLSPTAISNSSWVYWTLWGNSVVMIMAIIFIFEYLYKNRTVAGGALNYIVRLLGAYALMMAGMFVWLLDGDVTLFVLSVIAEMVVYFTIVLDEKRLTAPPEQGWLTMPNWAFALLGSVFLAEFFMGGVLDIQANGTSYFTGLPFASLAGSALTVAGAAFYDFIVFVSSITASFLFLAMMGVEMGALVVFKIRYAREAETKIRLVLIIVAYAIYSLYLPVFVLGMSMPQVPWVGWSMGLGTAGALAPAVILALLATYLISGGLSFFFGSRQVCSLFCTAALMYQGTTLDAMSSFNRTSKLGRKYLTSRIPSAYKVVVTTVWGSLLVAAVLSYLTSVGVVNVTVFGADTGYFLFAFYFSFLWYMVWMVTPFVGTYGCATTGVCGWGAFNQLISRIGLFRLKVKDSDQCIACKTKDCAKVCPVGLTDMPGAFIDKGEFRSFKCIGVGDCVSACPYENVFFFDARNWVRTKLNRPLPPLTRPGGHGVSESPLDFRALGEEAR
jgi:polyferredoxin